MANSHSRFSHALVTSHRDLIAELEKGIQQFKANLQFSNSHNVIRYIERFVDALNQIPGGQDELKRRATLIETSCRPGSGYDTARAESLQSYRGQPRRLTGSKLAIDNLREPKDTPVFLADIDQERQDIERVLNEGILKFSDAGREAFKRWGVACRAVQRDADPLAVDGCWHLLHIHESSEDNPTDSAKTARAIIRTDMGGADLDSIKAAADSLVDWVTENAANTDVEGRATYGSKIAAPVKPKRSTESGEGRVKLIASLTLHHRYADGSCLNLEPIGNNELAREAEVSRATASGFFKNEFKGYKGYRIACRDATRLVGLLKLLNQEFSPHHLFGDKPPGEHEDK